MLSITSLGSTLSRRVLNSDFLQELFDAGRLPPALEAFADEAALVAFLNDAPRYATSRDAVLLDLVRVERGAWARASPDVILLAFLPSVLRVLDRVRATSRIPFEDDLADAVAATLDAIRSYDPDHRSPHVQANVELDAFNAFYRRWLREGQRKEVVESVAVLANDAHKRAGDKDICFFPGVADPQRWDLTPKDIRVGRKMLRYFVKTGELSAIDASLIVEVHLRGRISTDVALEFGIDRRTVVRRVDRAAGRIRALVSNYFSGEMPVSRKR